jgi:hypothetical protein
VRLYRGLTKPYRSDFVPRDQTATAMQGRDFSDCPFAALAFARGSRGVLLVLDVPDDYAKMREEIWLDSGPRRFMIWGAFDRFIVAELPAKELRTQTRLKALISSLSCLIAPRRS